MLVCHLTQDTLEVRRLGRGAIERGRARTDLHPKGADHPRAPSGPGQHRIEEIRGRAFPVCPVEAEERERAGRLAEEGAAEGGQGDAGVGDHDLCHTWGTSVGRCTTTAAAPRAIASDTNACPSCCRPGMATKSPPDRTALEW